LIPSPSDPSEAIDVVFVPDDDYGNMSVLANRQAFITDALLLITEGFSKNNGIDRNFELFNFWYIHKSGDVQPGSDTCPSVTWPDLTDVAFAEVIVLVHQNELRDCRWGNRVTSEPNSFRTVVHEASHAAFGLPDEYCCDGGYWKIPPILYKSSNGCNNDPVNATWRDCQSFTDEDGMDWWRSENEDCDIMSCGGSVVLEYGRADWVIVKNVLSSLPGAAVKKPTVFAPDEWP
jgi:hypothetical protein